MADYLKNLAEPTEPLGVQSVSIEEDGSLSTRSPRFPLHFRFNWRYARFNATVDRHDERLVLCLGTELGQLPYTAEDSARRSQLVETVSGIKKSEFGRIDVHGGRVAVVTQDLPLSPRSVFTPSELVTSIAVAILGAAPCLDLLAEGGLFPRAAA